MRRDRNPLAPGFEKLGKKFVANRAKALFRHPLFVFLTFAGNGFMVFGAVVFFFLEYQVNAKVQSFVDALWWSVQTVTTVGYGDISPITVSGRFVGMGLMIFGTALFSAFTALFATVLLEPEISEVESEVRELERAVNPNSIKRDDDHT